MQPAMSRRSALSAAVAGGACWITGCGSGSKTAGAIHTMGDRVQVGGLIYTITEAEWVGHIGTEEQPRLPKDRFVIIRLSVTNAGSREIALPFLRLEDETSEGVLELSEVVGVPEWLGILRNINPADTLQGRIVFDTRPVESFLRVTDGGDLDREITALVRIPVKFGA